MFWPWVLAVSSSRSGLKVVRSLSNISVTVNLSNYVRTNVTYIQGQSPEPRIREYFYYIDHQGQLFLDDTKVKNFVTCFKDKKFLVFFFNRLRVNQSGRYQEDFPFLSLCGRERNFIRCDDQPLVFTHLLQQGSEGSAGTLLQQGSEGSAGTLLQQGSEGSAGTLLQQGSEGSAGTLSYCWGGEKLSVPFRPEALYMHPASGRVYHPCSERQGAVGLVRSALAIEFSSSFIYPPDQSQSEQPTHFLWGGQQLTLTNELASFFPREEEDWGGEGGAG